MWPNAHPIKIQGRKIPQGTAVPEVMQVKKYQQQANIIRFTSVKSFPSDIKVLIVLLYESNKSVASLL